MERAGLKGIIYPPPRTAKKYRTESEVKGKSLGQRMRCNMAAVFFHDPEIVFLDEPTIGLDITVKADIRALIKKINNERKTTFIVTSHDFQDIEAVCQRIIIINHGSVVIDSPISEIRSVFGTKKTLRFDFENKINDVSAFEREGIIDMSGSDNVIEMVYETAKVSAPVLIEHVSSISEIKDISINEATIEAIISDILGG